MAVAALKGIYILAVLINQNVTVEIGALGKILFQKGFYAYVGSAQNNLEKRLKRHFEKTAVKKKFWHIDHLVAAEDVKVVTAFFKEAEKTEECTAAQSLAKFGFPIKGFGCSDCRCESHLYMFDNYSLLETVCLKLGFKPFPLSRQ